MSGRALAGLAVVVTLAASGAVAAPSLAQADSYTVTACSPFTTPGPFTEVDTDPGGLSVGNMCGGAMVGALGTSTTGALYAQDDTASPGTHIPGGAQAGWSFTAPAGTLITAVSYYRSLAAQQNDLVAGLFQGNGAALEMCAATFQDDYSCSDPNNQVPVAFSGLSTGGLFFGVECQLQGTDQYCLSGSPGFQYAQANMYSVSVTLTEQSSPVVSGPSGPLWEGGVVSGTLPLGFTATDPSGIESFTVSAAGTVLASEQQSCNYTQPVPCPELQPASLAVDTTRVPDGATQLSLAVTDAAGNTTVVSSPALVIDNNGPPAPASLSASAVGAGSDVVNLAWSDPASSPQPVSGAFAQLCQASCTAPVAVSPGGAAQVSVPGPGDYTVRLWLTDSAGRGGPQNAATAAVDVPAPTPVIAPSETGGGSSTKQGGTTGPGTKHAASLRVSHRLRAGRLTVNIGVPAGEHGRITIGLYIRHAGRLQRIAQHEVRPRHAKASAVFNLSRRERRAAALVVRASAAGAKTASLTIHPRG